MADQIHLNPLKINQMSSSLKSKWIPCSLAIGCVRFSITQWGKKAVSEVCQVYLGGSTLWHKYFGLGSGLPGRRLVVESLTQVLQFEPVLWWIECIELVQLLQWFIMCALVGYSTLLSVLGVRCLPQHTFLQYVDHGLLQLTEPFVSRLMTGTNLNTHFNIPCTDSCLFT